MTFWHLYALDVAERICCPKVGHNRPNNFSKQIRKKFANVARILGHSRKSDATITNNPKHVAIFGTIWYKTIFYSFWYNLGLQQDRKSRGGANPVTSGATRFCLRNYRHFLLKKWNPWLRWPTRAIQKCLNDY